VSMQPKFMLDFNAHVVQLCVQFEINVWRTYLCKVECTPYVWALFLSRPTSSRSTITFVFKRFHSSWFSLKPTFSSESLPFSPCSV
jgi:hypothetical protein